MPSTDLLVRFEKLHRWWVVFNTLKIFALTTALALLLSFSGSISAAGMAADIPALGKTWPLISVAFLCALLSYLARLAEITAERRCTDIRQALNKLS